MNASSFRPPLSISSSLSLSEQRQHLRAALGHAMEEGVEKGWSEEAFNTFALEIFRYQVAANPVYGAFVRNRSMHPDSIDDWTSIPAVPARAFKELSLVSGDPSLVEATFLTSGTTRGSEARGSHPVRDLSLYRASLLPMALRHLHPMGRWPKETSASERRGEESSLRAGSGSARIRIVALLPPPKVRPESSLAHMAGVLMEEWGDGRGGFFASEEWTLDFDGLERALHEASSEGVPTLLLGTAFAFVYWLDEVGGRTLPALPPNSVLMETGGYKGRTRTLPRNELYSNLSAHLGLSSGRIINEYGMTEMLSQFYEPVLEGAAPPEVEGRWHMGPPWVRTRILDPGSLTPVPAGEPGILCHYDLANLDSVSGILTEDWGVEVSGGFRLLGRLLDAEPRGCSLSMEELLQARGEVRL